MMKTAPKSERSKEARSATTLGETIQYASYQSVLSWQDIERSGEDSFPIKADQTEIQVVSNKVSLKRVIPFRLVDKHRNSAISN